MFKWVRWHANADVHRMDVRGGAVQVGNGQNTDNWCSGIVNTANTWTSGKLLTTTNNSIILISNTNCGAEWGGNDKLAGNQDDNLNAYLIIRAGCQPSITDVREWNTPLITDHPNVREWKHYYSLIALILYIILWCVSGGDHLPPLTPVESAYKETGLPPERKMRGR